MKLLLGAVAVISVSHKLIVMICDQGVLRQWFANYKAGRMVSRVCLIIHVLSALVRRSMCQHWESRTKM